MNSFLFVICFAIKHSVSDMLSNSKLIQCDNSDGLICENKLIIQYNVWDNKINGAESIQLTLMDADKGSDKIFFDKVQINITSSIFYHNYPAKYIGTFYAKPSEVKFEGGVFEYTCSKTKCIEKLGIKYDGEPSDNDPITGFCCKCTEASDGKKVRGTTGTCFQWFIFNYDAYKAQHCLQLKSDLKYDQYQAYEIENYHDFYEINITMQDNNNSTTHINKTISLSNTVIKDKFENYFSAQITQPPLSFEPNEKWNNMILLKPKESSDINDWLIVARHNVTIDGSECNKIGSSYTAFSKGTSSQCYGKMGDCLNNQIFDFIQNDVGRIESGLEPLYLKFRNKDINYFSPSSNEIYLRRPISGNSVVNLLIGLNADNLTIFNNIEKGFIQSVECSAIDNAEAGKIEIEVKNLGSNVASFTIDVDCSKYVFDIFPETRDINSNDTIRISKKIQVTYVGSASNNCIVYLRNSKFDIIDSKGCEFETREIKERKDVSGDNFITNNSTNTNTNACKLCNWNPVCLVFDLCSASLYYLLPITVLIIYYFYRKRKKDSNINISLIGDKNIEMAK